MITSVRAVEMDSDSGFKDPVSIKTINEMVTETTKCLKLESPNILYELNELMQNGSEQAIVEDSKIEKLGNNFNFADHSYNIGSCYNIWMHAKSRMRNFIKIRFNRHRKVIEDSFHFLFFTTSDKVKHPEIIKSIRR